MLNMAAIASVAWMHGCPATLAPFSKDVLPTPTRNDTEIFGGPRPGACCFILKLLLPLLVLRLRIIGGHLQLECTSHLYWNSCLTGDVKCTFIQDRSGLLPELFP